MKQTSSALTFLLAQYRAIFKHAYIKGLAPAVLLTAGLAAAGSAQANSKDLTDPTNLPGSGETITITGNSNNPGSDEYTNLRISSGSTPSWDGELIITSGEAVPAPSGNFITANDANNTTLTGKGKLTINISDETKYSSYGVKIAGNTQTTGSGTVTIDLAAIDVQNGSLIIADEATTGNSGTVAVKADNITVGSDTDELTAFLTLISTKDKGVTLGRDATDGQTASKITVNNGGKLLMQGSGSSGATILGEALTLKAGAVMLTDTGANNKVQTDDFTIGSGSFKVISGSNTVSETFLGKTGTVQGNVLVGNSGTWVIGQGKDASSQAIGTAVTFESGANIQLSGTLTVSGGKLTVADGANLVALAEKGTGEEGTIKVTASSDPSSSGTLVIGVDTLQDFLSSGNEYTAIVDDNGKYKLDTEADPPVTSKQGALLVSGGGILKLQSDKQFDLADTKTFDISGGTAASAGKIVISGSTIVADDVLVSKKIGNLASGTHNVLLEVNNLTLGDDSSSTVVSDFGFSGATTHNLTLLTKGDTFTLQNDVTLHATTRDVMLDDQEIEAAADGNITGNLTVSGSTLKVDAGHYTTNYDLKLADGNLTVTSTAGTKTGGSSYYTGGIASSLTIKGDFALTKNTTAPEIEVTGTSGADAVLDLRQARSVDWGKSSSGTITLSGAVADISATEKAGQGILYLKGDQLEDYFDSGSSSAKMEIKSGGLLSVERTTTSLEYDVSKFASGTAGSPTANKINFAGAGTFETDTALTLNVAKDAAAGSDVLAIGAGTIKAPSIVLNNNKATEFTISGGTLQVASGLTSNVGSVVFKDDGNSSGGKLVLDGAGSVTVKNLTFSGTNSTLNVESGKWTAQNAAFDGADFTVGTADSYASLELSNLNLSGTGVSGSVYGELTVATMQSDKATTPTITINDGANMTITGRAYTGSEDLKDDPSKNYSKTAGINLKGTTFNVKGAEAQLKLGNTAVSALITGAGTGTEDKSNLKVDDALKAASYTLDGFSTLYLDFAKDTQLNAADAKALKEQLFKGDNVGDGIINVGAASLAIKWTDESKRVTTWDNVKEFAEIESVTSDTLKQALITDVKGTVAGHYGAMQVAASTDLTVDGNLGLHAARDGYFVFSQSGESKTAEGVVISDGSLLLAGAGKIGDISAGGNNVTIAASTLENAVAGVTEVQGALTNAGILKVSNETTVSGNVSADSLELSTALSNSTYDMTFGSVDLAEGSTLSTTNLTLNHAGTGLSGSWIEGAVEVAKGFNVNAGEVTIANGTLSAQDTKLASGVSLYVGLDGTEQDDPSTPDFDESESFTGTFETATLELNGGTLIVDPEYGQATALASIGRFADASDADFTDKTQVGTIDGSIFVGQNSALGIGTENKEALAQLIARYQSNGSLSNAADRLGAIVYLGGISTLEDGQGLVLTNKSLADFVTYYNDADGVTTPAITAANFASKFKNAIFFGDGTALMADADAIKAARDQGTALVTMASSNGKLIADGGEILITGDLRGATDYTLFADHGGTGDANGTKVSVHDIKGQAVTSGNGITVTTENGFLVGEINDENGGVIQLKVADNARSLMSGASDPVYQTLVAYFNGYNSKWTEDGQEHYDYLYDGYELDDNGEVMMGPDDQPIENRDYSNYFLAAAVGQGNGAAAEAAARLGVYGGAPQAALSAGKSSTDAIASRFGIGSAFSNLTLAGNTQGATLWLAPVYKSADSDGFEAQGVDYGVDVDLYGVALGADYTLSNGITFGAMFNVGSGDIDGEGAAAAVSNDFDYYGFGIYGGYSVGPFSVIGDISYTVADNEIEANTSVDRIGAKMDSSNLSLGVTGKYALEFNGVAITPHAGLRFSNIDLDDYTIDGEDVVASVDSDSLNLFAIPVGVTIAKEFKGESWTVAPSFDLTLTGQFGDDELDGDVSWAGVSNLTTHTTTEVLDNFTYGATLGVEAQSVGGIALGLSVGYTGSSNTDEFGVNANARFTF